MKPLFASCLTAAALLIGGASTASAQSGLHGIDWHGPGIYQGGDDDRARGRGYTIRSPYFYSPYYYGGYGNAGYPYGYGSYPYGGSPYGGYTSYNVPLGGGLNYSLPLSGYGYPSYGYSYPGYYYGY